MKKDGDKDLLLCGCYSSEHQMIIHYSEDEGPDGLKYPMVYAHVHLNSRSFLHRLHYGLRYIFGRKSRYGAWDEFIFDHKDADKLQLVVDYLRKEDTYKKEQRENVS